jgi:hypothetical protein
MTEALADSVVTDPVEVAQYAQRIGQQAQRLSAMVDDLFQLSRISSGALRLSLSAIPLGDVVSDALAAEAAIAERKGVRLQADACSDWPIVQGSDPELARVVRNLLSNAIPAHVPGWHRGGRRGSPQRAGLATGRRCLRWHLRARPGLVFDVAYRGNTARTRCPLTKSAPVWVWPSRGASSRLIPAASRPANTVQAAASRSNSRWPPAHPTQSETRPEDHGASNQVPSEGLVRTACRVN